MGDLLPSTLYVSECVVAYPLHYSCVSGDVSEGRRIAVLVRMENGGVRRLKRLGSVWVVW